MPRSPRISCNARSIRKPPRGTGWFGHQTARAHIAGADVLCCLDQKRGRVYSATRRAACRQSPRGNTGIRAARSAHVDEVLPCGQGVHVEVRPPVENVPRAQGRHGRLVGRVQRGRVGPNGRKQGKEKCEAVWCGWHCGRVCGVDSTVVAIHIPKLVTASARPDVFASNLQRAIWHKLCLRLRQHRHEIHERFTLRQSCETRAV